MNFSQLSATDIAAHIASREISCEDIVRHFIREEELWNPRLNAMVENRWDEALAEAREKDAFLAENPEAELPPLFGVPVTIKEMIAVEGFHSTMGSIHRKDNIKSKDASVVKRLKDAGAIILGTTNVPELGFWFECENPIYGATSNPYDLTRTAGGSSGGEAALIGAGASVLGLGSDVGGSIRMPASFCGVFGHKPSNRIVPATGHEPVDFDNALEMTGSKYPLTTIGPLARKAKDLRLAMELIIGPDGYDQEVKKDFKLSPPIESWEGAKVWILPSPTMTMVAGTDEDMSEAVLMAGKYLEGMGAELKTLRHDFFKSAILLWSAGLAEVEGETFEKLLFENEHPSIPLEIFRSFTTEAKYTLPGLLTTVAERISTKFQKHTAQLEELNRLRDQLNQLLAGKNILILPAHPRKAPKLHSTYLRPFDFAMTAIFNVLGVPATAVPIAQNEGLPTGVQIISAWGQDHVTLSAAESLEQAFGGWQAPEVL
ncbi:MAG: hypothetical protein ABS42_00055 [Bdellovibrio sp. SCN 50-8]|nr:MAG: hypothetical protein ABS42_00055 [Bdellovibrio sp. SCN 50-8]